MSSRSCVELSSLHAFSSASSHIRPPDRICIYWCQLMILQQMLLYLTVFVFFRHLCLTHFPLLITTGGISVWATCSNSKYFLNFLSLIVSHRRYFLVSLKYFPQDLPLLSPPAFQSLDRDSPFPGVLIITSSVPSHGLLMESCALGFLQEFSVCCSQESRKSSHNWYWNKNNKFFGLFLSSSTGWEGLLSPDLSILRKRPVQVCSSF